MAELNLTFQNTWARERACSMEKGSGKTQSRRRRGEKEAQEDASFSREEGVLL